MKSPTLLALLTTPIALLIGFLIGSSGPDRPALGAAAVAARARPTSSGDTLASKGSSAVWSAAAPDGGRVPHEADALARRPAQPSRAAAADLEGAAPGLIDELDRLLASGRIQASLIDDPQALRAFLLQRYFALGDLGAAWELLETTESSANDWRRLAQALAKAEQTTRAIAALERAFAMQVAAIEAAGGPDWRARRALEEALELLRGLDPEAALTQLDALAEAVPGFGEDQDLDRAGYLLAAGRVTETFALWDRAMDGRFERLELLESLAASSAPEAELYIRERLAAVGSDAALEATLAAHLIERERPEEALELLDGVLASGDPLAVQRVTELLGQLPDEIITERLDAWLDVGADRPLDGSRIGLIGHALDRYAESGRESEAVDLQLDLLARLGAGESGAGWIPTLPPELSRAHAARLEPALRAAEGSAGGDDEVWGDLADMYWDAGLEADARRCWERAWELDPSDGEWIENLRQVESGRLPR